MERLSFPGSKARAECASLTLAVSLLFWMAACSQVPAPEPTPNIDATVEARVAEANPTDTPLPTPDIQATVQAAVARALPSETPTAVPDVQATVQAGVQATIEAMPTETPTSIPTPFPTHTPTPVPTNTPTPVPTNTPTPVPTNTPTPVPANTPAPVPANTPAPVPANTPAPVPANTPTPAALSIADVVAKVRAGVVLILGNATSGSGFVVDPTGYILTNEHVVAGQSELEVVFDDGTRLTPRVVGSDAVRDIALLKVEESQRLTALPFASIVREGEEVVALGYPLYDLDELAGDMTVTNGIVSAFRTFRGNTYIQTNAAINPGNSGGPLLNLKGEVVGMNTSSYDADVAQGISFSVRYDDLASLMAAMQSGTYTAPALTSTPTVLTSGSTFGPESGSLDHSVDDGFAVLDSDTDTANLVVSATFTTPDKIHGDYWDAGFLLRETTLEQFVQGTEYRTHSIAITSSGNWYHDLLPEGADEYELVQERFSPNIRTGANSENHLRITAVGDTGLLFINGVYEAKLDLSGLTDSGTVSINALSDKATTPTNFSRFKVRPLEVVYGPSDGSIEYDPDFIDEHDSRTSLADGIIEARFLNPYSSREGNWSSGFLFRGGELEEFHAVIVDHEGWWVHRLRTSDTEPPQELSERTSPHISTDLSGSNHLRIVALGEEGWLFINGVYIDKLDLSGLIEAGSVVAVSSYFEGDGVAGRSTRFEGFTIWTADGD